MQEQVGLIGDVVGSRASPDRAELQRHLVAALATVSDRSGGRLAMTLGDEFQGRYPDLEAAISASLLLHLSLLGVARLRLGIGRGALAVEDADASPFGQDGPVWWRAREAVELLASEGDRAWTQVNTGTEWDELLNAYLRMRDKVVSGFDQTDALICLGLLAGMTQKALASEVGLNQSSVSRRVNSHGLAALVATAGFRVGPLGDPD